MRLLNTVIYTDKLEAVREFYAKHFQFPLELGNPHAVGVQFFAEATVTFIDAASAGVLPTQGVLLRLSLPFTVLERARLLAAGIPCGELTVEDWGSHYGKAVQYFTMTDPSGAKVQIFEDRYGEEKQLMTTGDGTGTRKVQEAAQQKA